MDFSHELCLWSYSCLVFKDPRPIQPSEDTPSINKHSKARRRSPKKGVRPSRSGKRQPMKISTPGVGTALLFITLTLIPLLGIDVQRAEAASPTIAAELTVSDASLTATSSSLSNIVAAASGTRLRPADFGGYCRARYQGGVYSASAWHKWWGSWTAVTWRCRQTTFGIFDNRGRGPVSFARIPLPGKRFITRSYDYEIDVNRLCRWQYGSHAKAVLVGQSWRDWRCRA